MDQLLDQARSIWEGEIDFEGQRLADLLTYALLSLSGAIAFLVGFSTQNIYQTLYIGLGGTALTFLAVVPPWPFYNQHPLPWLQARDTGRVALGTLGLEGISVEVDGQRVS
ncbi:hypothetical protein LTR91_010438 [Friedmanniomyces endolithicus]|uniref:Signal peptidase complex subunit 1 n=1 Tax=Friedmanniomyces endolithicus TaxID=329885 RepID=A0AAN6FWR5_9PEZI|nr:hypothetical protein LTR35_001160 [Friedmanniomyces endolithicus]KAK0296594.1 hypothetical protein LTS00_004919 [Friedmanniomyces endolithicus]KAK0324745.1 hypothetical protein LTR82_004450 [Friedmanniomyces endolithicus]KAK0932221.1 hypothetical protein LTR57_000441 [Friedmanniomyces endolithicus]KAK0985856.1 hypothetical protein LTR91_010438 [Friedmanniomyces endolithicus]